AAGSEGSARPLRDLAHPAAGLGLRAAGRDGRHRPPGADGLVADAAPRRQPARTGGHRPQGATPQAACHPGLSHSAGEPCTRPAARGDPIRTPDARRAAAFLPHRVTESPAVYLTFDDGPDPRWTPQILDILAAHDAPATFFALGCHARSQPELLRRVRAEGHAVGNHTYSHRHPWKMLARRARAEVRDGAAAIAAVLGERPRHYRPPHGRLRRCMVDE